MHASRIVSFSTPGPFDWPPISTVPAQHIYRPFTAPIYSLFTVGGGDQFVRVLIILAILYSREDVVFMSRIWIGRKGVTFREEGRRLERDGWLDWNGYSNLILIGMIDFGSFRCTGGRGGWL